mmetsp:Transcript_6596/g.15874  ORF Transcript_6596/g.15874 Transcript_6596/m.15874 type:complete len:210 (-) Transcript_6596:656-1285(-)
MEKSGDTARSRMPWVCPCHSRSHCPVRMSQQRSRPSRQDDTRRALSDPHATLFTACGCSSLERCVAVPVSQTPTLQSTDAVAHSGRNLLSEMHSTESVCPLSSAATRPVAKLDTCTPPSSPPETAAVLSAATARQTRPSRWKGPPCPPWSCSATEHSPVFGFHTLRLPSCAPVTTLFPSGVNCPQFTEPPCPEKTCMHLPVRTFHIQTE